MPPHKPNSNLNHGNQNESFGPLSFKINSAGFGDVVKRGIRRQFSCQKFSHKVRTVRYCFLIGTCDVHLDIKILLYLLNSLSTPNHVNQTLISATKC